MNGNLRADKKKCLAQFLKVQSIHCSHPSNSFIIHLLFFPILIFSCSLLRPTNVSIPSVFLLLAIVPLVFGSINTVLQAFNLSNPSDLSNVAHSSDLQNVCKNFHPSYSFFPLSFPSFLILLNSQQILTLHLFFCFQAAKLDPYYSPSFLYLGHYHLKVLKDVR